MSSLIAGTMRLQDLIPVLFEELKSRSSIGVKTLRFIYPVELILSLDENDPQWSSQAVLDFYASLVDELDEAAPTGMYFGSHPGDGSDFGFWYNDAGVYLIDILEEFGSYLQGMNREEPEVVLQAVKEELEEWACKIEKYLEETREHFPPKDAKPLGGLWYALKRCVPEDILINFVWSAYFWSHSETACIAEAVRLLENSQEEVK